MKSMNNMKKEQKEQVSKEKEKKYVDANCFIYAAIDSEIIGEKAKNILSDVKEGKFIAYTSTLTIDEFLWKVQKEVGRELAAKSVNIFLTIPNLELINVDINIITKAIDIYKSDNLDPRDAIHLASMRQKNIKAIITSDSDFNKIKDIKVIDFTK